jgi:tetratricopeptide (TPR) repeat protein
MSLDKVLEITGDGHAKQRVRQALGQLYRRYPPRSEERQARARNLVALSAEANDASVLNDLGLMQDEEEAHTAAIATFERALALLDGGSTALRATLYGNLAVAQAKIGSTESAIRNFSDALKIEEAIGNREGVIYQLRDLGQLYLQRKEWELAIPLLKRAADLGEGITSAYKRAEISGMLGDALVAIHRQRYTLRDTSTISFKTNWHGFKTRLGKLTRRNSPWGLEEWTQRRTRTDSLSARARFHPDHGAIHRSQQKLQDAGNDRFGISIASDVA